VFLGFIFCYKRYNHSSQRYLAGVLTRTGTRKGRLGSGLLIRLKNGILGWWEKILQMVSGAFIMRGLIIQIILEQKNIIGLLELKG